MTPEEYWKHQASHIAFRVNFGWWVKSMSPWVLGTGVGGIVGFLVTRRFGWIEAPIWLLIGLVLIAGAIVSVFRTRPRWFNQVDGLIRLDKILSSNSRLIAANSGNGDWPRPRGGFPPKSRLDWNQRETLLPMFGIACLLMAAAWIPIPEVVARGSHGQIEEPPALKQAKDWIKELEKNKELEQEKVEELAKQLSTLTKKEPREWFNQSSLEAADNLQTQVAQSVRELRREAGATDQVMQTLAKNQNVDPEMAKELAKQLGAAMQGLENGKLGPSKEMMNQLKQIDPSKMGGGLTKEQMEQLQKNLAECKNCLSSLSDFDPQLSEGDGEGDGDGDGEGEKGEDGDGKPGRGGVNRGRGDAPLTLNSKETHLETEKVEGLSNPNYNRALPAETLSVTSHKPQAEGAGFEVSAGGASQQGQGGEAVWRDNLMPAEREALRPYFK